MRTRGPYMYAQVGLAAQFLETDEADRVVILTIGEPAGRAAETLLPEYGFSEHLEYRYVSEEHLETVTANEFLKWHRSITQLSLFEQREHLAPFAEPLGFRSARSPCFPSKCGTQTLVASKHGPCEKTTEVIPRPSPL